MTSKLAPAISLPISPPVSVKPPLAAPRYHEQKHWLDRALATVLLVAFAPIIVFLIALVRLTSRGPAVYRQMRVGKDGRCFVLYKLRSMVANAESDGPVWSCGSADSRITGIGRFLRSSHLDELPQLWNVCLGDMALVGPRPERPELVDKLETRVPGYLDRLVVRPGISGLAQINLPPDSCIGSVERKLKLDMEYIRTATPVLDFLILVWTSARCCGVPSMWAARRLGLWRQLLPLQNQPDGPVLVDDIF